MPRSENFRKLAAFSIGAGGALGIVVALVVLIPDQSLHATAVESALRQGSALMLMTTGLGMLFPLAAFGPQSEQAAASRVSRASVGVVQVVLAVAQIAPSLAVRAALTTVSVLIALAASLKIPRGVFRVGPNNS